MRMGEEGNGRRGEVREGRQVEPLCGGDGIPLYLFTSVPLHPCTFLPLYLCTPVPLHPCTSAPLYLCTPVPLHPCTSVPLYPCTITPLRRYAATPLRRYLYGSPILRAISWNLGSSRIGSKYGILR